MTGDDSLGSRGEPAPLRRQAETFHQQGKFTAAIRIYHQLIQAGHEDAELLFHLADAHADLGEFSDAIPFYLQSLAHDAVAPTLHQLARAQYQLGMVDAAVLNLRQAIDLSDALAYWTSLATIVPGAPGATHDLVRSIRQSLVPKLLGSDAAARANGPPRRPPQEHPLRVGYLSSFFHASNYMKPVWAAVGHHNRDAVEVHLLCDDRQDESSLPGYRPRPTDSLHQVGDDSNQQLLERIRELQLHVLVDLNAYSNTHRLGLFVEQPTAVTASWFNSYATSGLPGISCLIGDRHVVRREEYAAYTERIVRLPISYLTFQATHPAPPVSPPPVLANGFLTFGSLVAQYKITDPVFDAWSEILHRTGESRLLLANSVLHSRCNVDYVRDQFQSRGVDPDRILLRGPAPHYEYLKYYEQIDIALDAFPYSGGTTTMEAIWQGVPVLTFTGDRWASRTSFSLLRQCHLREFATSDLNAMIQQAIQLAAAPQTPNLLAKMRAEMRSRLLRESVMDAAALARHLERIYRALCARTRTS